MAHPFRFGWALAFLLPLIHAAGDVGGASERGGPGRANGAQNGRLGGGMGFVGSPEQPWGWELARVSPWALFPGQRAAFEVVLRGWNVKLEEEGEPFVLPPYEEGRRSVAWKRGAILSEEERNIVWELLEGVAVMPLGIPAEMLRLDATQDALLALSTALIAEARVRGAWGLVDANPNRTAGLLGQLLLQGGTQPPSGADNQEGAVGLAQESYMRCKRTGEAPALFSPSALSLTAGPGGASGRKIRKEPMDLLDAARSGVIWIRTHRAQGWCHFVSLRVQNVLLSRVFVRVRAGTLLEHAAWNGQRGLTVKEDVDLAMAPAEGRNITLPTVCTDRGGLLPDSTIALTPFVRMGTKLLLDQKEVYRADGGTQGGTSSDALVDAARRDAESRGKGKQLAHILKQHWAPNINSFSRGTGTTALMDAARLGQHKVVSLLITVGNASTSAADGSYMTALHHAVRGGVDEEGGENDVLGRVEAARRLLLHGADVDAVDRFGWTALMHAARAVGARKAGAHKSSLALLEVLLKSGANVSVEDKDGHTALAWACWSAARVHALQPFLDSCNEKGCQAMVNSVNRLGVTPLMMVAQAGVGSAALLLLQNGANVNSLTRGNQTALMFAAQTGSEDVVQALLEHGADALQRDTRGFIAEKFCPTELPKCMGVLRMLREAQPVQEGDANLLDSFGVAVMDLLWMMRNSYSWARSYGFTW